MRKITRRRLLRGAAGLAAVYAAGQLLPAPAMPQARAEDIVPQVVVAEGTNDDTAERYLRAALAPLGGIERFVKPGQYVCIKPNATWANKPNTASSTDPDLLRALIALVKAAGAKRIVCVDHCTIDPPAMCLAESGLGRVLDETGVERAMMDGTTLPESAYVAVDLPDGKSVKTVNVIKQAAEADVVINMAVAKTHLVLPVTLCLKHMMGFLQNPWALHASFDYLDQGIADICTQSKIKPALHILEAFRVRVKGPSYGDGTDITDPTRVKRKNKLIVGTDPVLMDAYAVTNFFDREPFEITHIKRAFETGVGDADVAKATSDGRLVSYSVAYALRPTVTPTPTITPEVAPEEQVLTATPRSATKPTATPAPAAARASTGDVIVDVGPMLDGALVPAAAAVGGVGLVVGRHLAGRLKHDAPAPDAPPPPLASVDVEHAPAPAPEPAPEAPAVAPRTAEPRPRKRRRSGTPGGAGTQARRKPAADQPHEPPAAQNGSQDSPIAEQPKEPPSAAGDTQPPAGSTGETGPASQARDHV